MIVVVALFYIDIVLLHFNVHRRPTSRPFLSQNERPLPIVCLQASASPLSSCSQSTCVAARPSCRFRACLTFHRWDRQEFSLHMFSGGVCSKFFFVCLFPFPFLALMYQNFKPTKTQQNNNWIVFPARLSPCCPHPPADAKHASQRCRLSSVAERIELHVALSRLIVSN